MNLIISATTPVFYFLIEDKLKELGITEKDYPINSIKIAEMYKNKLIIEYRKFPSPNIGRIIHKGSGISSMCLYFSVLGKRPEL